MKSFLRLLTYIIITYIWYSFTKDLPVKHDYDGSHELNFALVIGTPLWSFLITLPVVAFYEWKFRKKAPVIPPVVEPDYTVMPTGDKGPQHSNIIQGSANFLSDLRKQQETEKTGLWLGGGFFHHKEGNLCTVAQPGSGKNAAIINVNLLLERDYPHSLVVFDLKGTNAAISARFQQEQGQKVFILDPSNIQGSIGAKHGITASNFNPLDFIGDNLVKGCEQIAHYLRPDSTDHKGKIWDEEARDLITGILLHIMTSPLYDGKRNLVSLYKLFRQKKWEDIFREMTGNPTEEVREVAKKFAEMYVGHPEGFTSVTMSTGKAINWLKEPNMQAAVQSSDFDPADIDKGGMTIYLCVHLDDVEVYATWARIIVGMLLQANTVTRPTPKAWCYYLLDEFTTMGNFPAIIKKLSITREYKIRLWIFAQSLTHLEEVYQVTGRNKIIGSSGVFQAFSVSDPVTVKYVSERLGKSTEFVKEILDAGLEKKQDERPKATARQLLTENEVEHDKNIITFSEIGAYRLRRWMYWKNPQDKLELHYYDLLKNRADPNPNYI